MLKLSFKRKEPETRLILDIGTDSVKAILYQKKEGKIIILETFLEYFDEFGAWDSFSDSEVNLHEIALWKAARKTVKEALEYKNKNIDQLPSELYVTLPPELLQTRVFRFSLERKEHSKHISKAEEQQIISNFKQQAEELIKKTAPNEDMIFWKFVPSSFSIDGYGVSSLRNFTGKHILCSALAIFVKNQVLGHGGFFEALSRFAKDFKIYFSLSNIVSLAESFAKVAPFLPDGIFIDIGGRETQVFILQQKSLVAAFDFPLGARQWMKIISVNFGLEEVTAREFLINYAREEFTKETRERIKRLLSPSILEWCSCLKKGLEEEKCIFLPFLFVFGGGVIPDVKEAIETGQLQDISFAASARVTKLLPEALQHLEYRGKKLLSPQDTSSFLLCYLS